MVGGGWCSHDGGSNDQEGICSNCLIPVYSVNVFKPELSCGGMEAGSYGYIASSDMTDMTALFLVPPSHGSRRSRVPEKDTTTTSLSHCYCILLLHSLFIGITFAYFGILL